MSDNEEEEMAIVLGRQHFHCVVLAVADAATFYSNALVTEANVMSEEVLATTGELLQIHLDVLDELDVNNEGILKSWTEGRDQALAKAKGRIDENANVIDIQTRKEITNDPTNEPEEHNSDGSEGEPDSST